MKLPVEYHAFCDCGWWDKQPTEQELNTSLAKHRKDTPCRRQAQRYKAEPELVTTPSDRPVYHAHTTDKAD